MPRQQTSLLAMRWLLGCLPLCLAGGVHADLGTASGSNSLNVSAKLTFSIAIAKYISLRVGNADASVSDVNFTVGLNPARPNGNSVAYTGTAVPPPMLVSAATTNPTSSASTLNVAAFTNVSGSLLSCRLDPLGGTTVMGSGATVAGIPGANDITVTSSGPASLSHPGGRLGGCNGTPNTGNPLAVASNLSGTYTYATAFTPSALKAGDYGVIVTYTVTTP